MVFGKRKREGRDSIRQMFGGAAETMTGMGNGAAPAPAPAATSTAPEPDPLDRLKKLEELRAAGIVTDSEFAEKKAQILSQL